MPIEIVHRYTRQLIQQHPNKLFIFGDNYARVGYGGQAAEARDEPNAVGVRTKLAPTYKESDFLTDNTYASNIVDIIDDFKPALRHLRAEYTVVWPADGIGTGIARLSVTAPNTLRFIEEIVSSLKQVYGVIK